MYHSRIDAQTPDSMLFIEILIARILMLHMRFIRETQINRTTLMFSPPIVGGCRLLVIKILMKSIESVDDDSCDLVFEPFGDAQGTWKVFWRKMALYMQSHVPDPIPVTGMAGADPPTRNAQG